MASELEVRTSQEEKLYDFLMFQKLVKSGKTKELGKHLELLCERTLAGMTGAQIDAVKQRVQRSFDAMYGE